jgi:predicted dehydrogenase
MQSEDECMRVGVIGGGYWGSKHVRVLTGLLGVDGVALIDPSDRARDGAKATNPQLSTFVTLDEGLRHVDAVVVATPPSSHGTLSRRALDAGKHVLVEKPLATSVRDARDLVHRATTTGVQLMVGHTFEYNAAVWRLRDAIHTGELGDVYYVDTARLNLGLYQPDVNVVWDLAPHDISILNHILGARPTTVQAWGRSHAHAYLEDVAHLRLEYSDRDVVGEIQVSWLHPRKIRRVTVVGSRRMAVYDDLADDERIRIYDKGVDTAEGNGNGNGVRYRHGGVTSPWLTFEEPLLVEDRHFVDCVTSGRRPATDGANGLAVVEVLVAAQESLRRGAPMHLEPCERSLTHAVAGPGAAVA